LNSQFSVICPQTKMASSLNPSCGGPNIIIG
jgi:hypothetical protein